MANFAFYKNLVKPICDFTISLAAFILVSPLLTVVIIVLSIVNSGTPFFICDRPGKNGNVFKMIKLKTMYDLKDDSGNLLPDSERITNIGKLLRNSSLDEIPQLLNVLKGDMSIIGPRPLAMEYFPLYNDFQKRRHEVKPGITGLAQVKGRNKLSWNDKFNLDVWYVDHISFRLDLKISYMTITKVFKQEGIGIRGSENNEQNFESFTGDEN